MQGEAKSRAEQLRANVERENFLLMRNYKSFGGGFGRGEGAAIDPGLWLREGSMIARVRVAT
jgi:hypothetical protein